MKRFCLIFPLFIFFYVLQIHCSLAQTFKFEGKITNVEAKESLRKSTIIIKGERVWRLPSDDNGEFSIELPRGTYFITIKSVGFETIEDTVSIQKDQYIHYQMHLYENLLSQIDVVSKHDKIHSSQTGTELLKMTEVEKIPVFLGEKDILKTIQLKPGVTSSGDGASGFYVRGGGSDQNLVLIDQMQIYNASHLLGFFSIFNTDALSGVQLYKGTQPSRYGGRLSSVLEVATVPGDTENWHFKGGVGLISSRFTVNGPIEKDKAGFNLSARRTYIDVFTRLSGAEMLKNGVLNFTDINGSVHYNFSDYDKVTLSLYGGRDNLGVQQGFGVGWGNRTASLHWDKRISNRLKSDFYLIYNNFDYFIKVGSSESQIKVASGVKSFNLKQDFSYPVNSSYRLSFGMDVSQITTQPQDVKNPASNEPDFIPNPKKGLENGIYLNNEIKHIGRFNLNLGVRISSFSVLGGTKHYLYRNQETVDSVDLINKAFGKTYFFVEPRFAVNYLLNNTSSLKFFYGRNTQNIHILNNSAANNPTDVYLLTNYNIRPEISDQISMGYFKSFKNNTYELGLEAYYKYLQNQIDYHPLTDINGEDFDESSLLYGVGKAYGLEFYLQKKSGRFTGWFSYTLSRTLRKIAGINVGNYYSSRQDRPHNISIVAMYDISKRLNISASWVYLTGTPVTYPSGKYRLNDRELKYYTSRNQDRLPDYHRMDISFNLKSKNQNKRFRSEWNFSIYNMYARENPLTIQLTRNEQNEAVFQQTALFKIIPSITYNFKF